MSMYQEHVQKVREYFDQALTRNQFDEAVIFSGRPTVAFLDDNSYPYRVNPLFKYWLPLTDTPNSFIFYKVGQKPVLYLYQIRDFWHAQPVIEQGEWQQEFDVVIVGSLDEALTELKSKASSAAWLSEQSFGIGVLNPSEVLDYIHYHRAYKTEYEIDLLRQANVLAAKGHLAAKDAFYAGGNELDIHHAYLGALRAREIEVPYNNIVALNSNGAILHYDKYEVDVPEEHRSFLIDAGALYKGYCADITRTYAFKQEGFYAELVQAMDEEEQGIIGEISIGKSYYDLHVSMHRRVAKLLSRFNFINLDAEAIFEKGYTRAFFPHGLGHYIGLQVHDVGGFLKNDQGDMYERDTVHQFLRLYRPIEAGQVFTVEPGLYVVDQLLEAHQGNTDFNWARIDELRPFGGVRVEDSVCVHEDRNENLTRDAFAAL